MTERKYPAAVYAAVSRAPMGEGLTFKQIDAVLDTAGRMVLIAELDDLSDGLCCGTVLENRMRELESAVDEVSA
jgi:hypothetical protein